MSKLYEISERYRNIQELLDNPELHDEDIKKALDSIGEEFDTKAENVAKVISSMSADAEGIKKEIERLQERKKAVENRVKGLKGYIYEQMQATGKKKIKGTLFTLAIQKNAPSVNVVDEDVVPEQYKIPQPSKLDKKAILEDLKQDKKINGVEIKQGTSLRIR
ncbi:MAG: siphovirus Gp157 family protein [Clostridium sp.]|jgi:chaperonin cofactor prefoldin|uniref:siphovirus Gp157 family protein n=1 Tax=Clostridium sp. TaxID=1506 RepID=UPI0025C51CF1|nr:siphovirus Gp157 family protein [Clostridium sp.]MCH3962959.1 siphovirus Gp157 family protein [Clostridium sp.]MCI1800168.1 siphovirus Gp157 family protein [Clostridium sp.]MCI2200163.1 siphovirus Gp157 family protein [Clostridium sp.]